MVSVDPSPSSSVEADLWPGGAVAARRRAISRERRIQRRLSFLVSGLSNTITFEMKALTFRTGFKS
jgi:hypothetical protein